jgi:hypothetical protein
VKKRNVLFLIGKKKKKQGHGMGKIQNSRRLRRNFYVPKCVESMLGNFLKKHDICLPNHLRFL